MHAHLYTYIQLVPRALALSRRGAYRLARYMFRGDYPLEGGGLPVDPKQSYLFV